jgi:two-component SAPR family response regulator
MVKTSWPQLSFVHHTSDHYRIAPEAVGVDLWQFQEILARVRVAEDYESRIAELEKVAALCRGPALDGAEFPWRDREGWPITRAVADALTQLAELHRRTDPDRAIEILGQCLNLDPDCEEGYRHIVSLQWHVGRRAEAAVLPKRSANPMLT